MVTLSSDNKAMWEFVFSSEIVSINAFRILQRWRGMVEWARVAFDEDLQCLICCVMLCSFLSPHWHPCGLEYCLARIDRDGSRRSRKRWTASVLSVISILRSRTRSVFDKYASYKGGVTHVDWTVSYSASIQTMHDEVKHKFEADMCTRSNLLIAWWEWACQCQCTKPGTQTQVVRGFDQDQRLGFIELSS